MSTLGCGASIKKMLEVSNDDISVIESTLAERVAAGVPLAQAQKQAVAEAVAQLAIEKAALHKAVAEQHPQPVEAPVDTPEPVAEPTQARSPEADHQAAKADVAARRAAEAKPVEAAAAPQTKEAMSAQPAKIEDFGEKLEGARKDYAATLKDAMEQDVAAVPLSKSWPEPDYDKLLVAGGDPFAVAFIHAARDEVPTKPQTSWKVKRWVQTVTLLRDMASKLMSGETSVEALKAELGKDEYKRLRTELGGRAELYQRVGHAQSLKGVRVTVGSYSVYKGVEYNPAKTMWSVEKAAKASAFSNWPNELAIGDTREQAIQAFVDKVKETPATPQTKTATFDLWRQNSKIHLGKKLGREYITLKTFDDVKAARAYRDANLAELTAGLERYRSTPFERKSENAPRVGADHRDGARMTPEVFAEAFGFRGVQFGNYVENSKRQQDLNDAYDSLMDMAAVLGIPPKALSLNGQLGLAFGARGKGGTQAAAAHYEPDQVVINLTKNSGAGSLAHEWFHAVDNYFAKLDGGKGGMMTQGVVNAAVRADMKAAFERVRKAYSDSAIRERSRNLDKRRSKPYWSTTEEMAARSFEAYIIAKLQDQNATNDYLANVVSEKFWQAQDALMGHEGEKTYPYPTEAEMGPIREAFDGFFDTVQTKETDKGVAMFKRASLTATPGSMKTAEIRKTLAPALAKLQLPHFIHNTTEDASKATGQAIPDDAKGFHWKGQVHLIAENIATKLEAQEVFWHEVQHAGLNEALGTGSVKYENALRAISLQNKNIREAARGWMERHGQEEQDHWISRGKTAEEALKRAKLQAVDEALAELSGRKGEKINGIAKFIAQVQQFLRSIGLNELAKWMEGKTNAEALSMILGAREAVMGEPSGQGSAQLQPAFSKEQAQLARGEDHKGEIQVDGTWHPAENSKGQPIHPTFEGQKAFWKWAGDTKVVDEQGRPLVVYHGTNKSFDTFDRGAERSTMMFRDAQGFYFTKHPDDAAAYADDESAGNVMPTYLSIKNPVIIERGDFSHTYVSEAQLAKYRAQGHDGMIFNGGEELVVFSPNQIKSATGNNGNFSTDSDNISFARAGATTRQYTPAQEAAMKNVGFDVEQPTVKERAKALWQDAGKKLAQGIVDQFAPVKDLDKQAYGLLRLAKGASGAFEAMLRGGQLKITDGVYDIDTSKRGGVVDKLLIPLGGEHHDFMRWVAANRAERLASEGKENLFTPADIAALKTLDTGVTSFDYTLRNAVHGVAAGTVTRDRTLIYRDSLAIFNEFNKNALDMAEQSGLIDGGSRHLWEHEFYVPFYRVADEATGGIGAANIKGSMVRQEAFKALKGGKNALNADLLDNTLMNWAHLLDAAAKNRGAVATLHAAVNAGLAFDAPSQYVGQQVSAAAASKAGLLWVMEGGQKRYYVLDQQSREGPFLLTALSALEYAGMRSPVMNAMGLFKHALTVGVTASPFFKVRNLIRDSVQAIGTGPLSYNVAGNLVQGFKLTDPKSDAYFRLLAGGGTIHFGTMLEGSEARRVQALVESGVKDSTILNSDNKVKAFYRHFIEPGISAYNELGNRGEAINRASLYAQLTAQGMGHAEASLQARDLMDFSMQGSFTSIRFLTQVVPFFNARIQGLYKLGRAAKEDPARFSMVLGATALMSVGLLAAYHDDDDWKKRELWDQQNFWWFKFGGEAFRIPKPFEIGAIATLAEHGAELAFSDEMTGKRFREAVLSLVSNNLSMNPIPQLVKPVLDVYSNQDSFSNRPIETMGMEKLKPEYRFNDRTSMLARGASTAANAVTGLVGADAPSPVQIDHLLRGYFGWLGSFVVGAGDALARPSTGQPTQAAPDYWKAATGGMISNLADAPSKYVSQMYTQAKEIEQAYGTWKGLLKEGKIQEAADFRQANLSDLVKYPNVERIKRAEAFQNQQIKAIERADLPADVKRERIRQVQERKDRMARALAPS